MGSGQGLTRGRFFNFLIRKLKLILVLVKFLTVFKSVLVLVVMRLKLVPFLALSRVVKPVLRVRGKRIFIVSSGVTPTRRRSLFFITRPFPRVKIRRVKRLLFLTKWHRVVKPKRLFLTVVQLRIRLLGRSWGKSRGRGVRVGLNLRVTVVTNLPLRRLYCLLFLLLKREILMKKPVLFVLTIFGRSLFRRDRSLNSIGAN